MRRVLLVCLLVMLPFHGVWAAVAGIAPLDAPCAAALHAAPHEAGGGDGGALASAVGVMVDCDAAAATEPCCGGTCGGCSGCHGPGLLALIGVPVALGSDGKGGAVIARSTHGAPDPVLEQPLRPPLPRLA